MIIRLDYWCSISDIEKMFMKYEIRLLNEVKDSSICVIAERVGAKIEAEADISAEEKAKILYPQFNQKNL